MGKLLAVFRREYVERVRNRWFVIATLFGPILFGTLMFLPALLSERSEKATVDLRQVLVLDATGTALGRRVASELAGGLTGDPERSRVRDVSPGQLPQAEAQARLDVAERRAVGFLTLDAKTLAGASARYVGVNAAALDDVDRIRTVLRRQVLAVRLERAGVDPATSASIAQGRLELKTEQLDARGRGTSGKVSSIFAVVIAVVLYTSILLYGQMVLRGVMEEKQSRVAEVVLSSVRADTLLAGKVLGVGAVGLTQLVLWTAVSYAMLQVRQPLLARFGVASMPIALPPIDLGTGVLLLSFFLLGYLFFAALFAIVGAVVSSEQEAQQAQTPIILLLVSSVAVLQPVLASPDGSLARVMSVLPFSAPIMMPLRMSLTPVPGLSIAFSLLAIALGALLAVIIAARVYRVGLLMYGKRPTLREIARWARQPA